MFLGGKGVSGRLNGWELRTAGSSALKELRRVASGYWSGQVMAKESVRKERSGTSRNSHPKAKTFATSN